MNKNKQTNKTLNRLTSLLKTHKDWKLEDEKYISCNQESLKS